MFISPNLFEIKEKFVILFHYIILNKKKLNEMKKTLLLLALFFGMVVFTACTKDDDDSNQAQYDIAEVQLRQDYSGYTIVGSIKWSVSEKYKVANFKATKNARATSEIPFTVWYDVVGEAATREMDVAKVGQTIPTIIQDEFNKTPYAVSANWTIEEIELESNYNDNALEHVYEVELVSTSNPLLEAEVYFNATTGIYLYAVEALGDDEDDIPFVVSSELKAAVVAIYPAATIIDAEEEDNLIEVKVFISGNTDIKDVELVFTKDNVFMHEEYETTYAKLDATKFAAVKTWFTTNVATNPIDATTEVEVIEAATGETVTDDGVTFTSSVEVEYEVGSVEYEIEFFLNAQNDIIDGEPEQGDTDGKYEDGTFILNDGKYGMDFDNPLVFIGEDGAIVDNAFKLVNGGTDANMLPSGTQDLYIEDDNIFFVSQSGALVIADAGTLKLKKTYTTELGLAEGLKPVSVVVLEDDVYILVTNNAATRKIIRFNLKTQTVTDVAGTNGVLAKRMAVVDDKIFATTETKLIQITEGSSTATELMTFEASVKYVTIIPTDEDVLWLAGGEITETVEPWGTMLTPVKPSKIMKFNTNTNAVTSTSDVADYALASPFAKSPIIAAIGDKIYFTSKTEAGVDMLGVSDFTKSGVVSIVIDNFDAHIKTARYTDEVVYNGVAVNPENNLLYINTYSTADYNVNDLMLFNVSVVSPVLTKSYIDMTHFPAGVYFTESF